VLEYSDIHRYDNGSGSLRFEVPPYTAEILNYLRRACQTKNESWSSPVFAYESPKAETPRRTGAYVSAVLQQN
jgi:hypothetical protein